MVIKELAQDFSDQEIIDRINNGEKNVFELLMRRYNTRMYRIGRSIIKDDAAIEDVMQNAYIKAYINLSRFEGRSAFGTWLVKILINECLAYVKAGSKISSMESNNQHGMYGRRPDELLDTATPANAALHKELGRALESAVLDLPEKYRIVFVMREMESMSIAETVEALSITESNVKVRLNRAKCMLREKLTTYYKSDLVFDFHLSRCDRIILSVFKKLSLPE